MVTPLGRLLGRRVQFSPHRVRVLYVRVLAALVAAAQQQVERLASSRIIDAVGTTVIYTQLAQASDSPPIKNSALIVTVRRRWRWRWRESRASV
jgi:hypothetical protein